jgi:hypothetical protein
MKAVNMSFLLNRFKMVLLGAYILTAKLRNYCHTGGSLQTPSLYEVLAVINPNLEVIQRFLSPDWLLGGCALLQSTINLKNLQGVMTGGLQIGDWDGVLKKVKSDLEKLIN